MATTRRSAIMLFSRFCPHVNKYGSYGAPVCGAPVNPEPRQTRLILGRPYRCTRTSAHDKGVLHKQIGIEKQCF
eukprot:9403366-Heterocapsa_arctica.AAC.1